MFSASYCIASGLFSKQKFLQEAKFKIQRIKILKIVNLDESAIRNSYECLNYRKWHLQSLP